MWHGIQISYVGFVVANSPVEHLNLLKILTVVGYSVGGFLVIATNQKGQQHAEVEH